MPSSQTFSSPARRVSIVFILALLALCSSLLVSALAGPGAGPAVTIDQGGEQPDPTNAAPIVFAVVFSEPVTGFGTGDVTLGGTAGATTALVFDSGDSTFFNVYVSGMTTNGTVIATVPAGVAMDVLGNPNQASTTTDNTVTFNGFVMFTPFIVTKTADTSDGLCDPDCSLREAIVAANANPGADTIAFNIPVSDPGRNPTSGVFTIAVDSTLGALPSITDQVTIDGYTQGTISTPGDTSDDATPNTNPLASGLNTRLLIELTDDAIGTVATGLTCQPGSLNSRIRGLSVFGFSLNTGISVLSAEGINIEGNFIGVRADGTAADHNGFGIVILNAPRATIGGSTPGTSNLISGNRRGGIMITGVVTTAEDRNSVLNNLIGTNALGTLGVPNGDSVVVPSGGGVLINDAGGVRVGGVGVGNVISGNNGVGIMLSNSGGGGETRDNIVQSNLIGTTANGTSALPNTGDGIEITNAQNNLIGGLSAADGNTIKSNLANGIAIRPFMGNESNNNTIASNTITQCGLDAVLIESGIGNRINSNSIFSNGQEGIDLLGDGITLNDVNDVDPITGPNANNLQNYPDITSSTANSLGSAISGTIDGGTPGTSYLVELFSNTACDGVNGQTLVGSTSSNASDANGDATFTFQTSAVLLGAVITATATDNTTNDTSEFSSCFVVTGEVSQPTVTINQAVGQSDPTLSSTINFTVVFSEPVNGFQTGDVTLSGTAGATTATVTGSGTTYNVAVTGMTTSGTVVATIGSAVATDLNGNPNVASTSLDNTVTFNIPGQLQFRFSTIRLTESGPAIGIAITRTGGSGGQVSVTFDTSNGTANAGMDYTAVNNFTVTFADGDVAEKTVTVPIIDDTAEEPDETVNLALTNPTGGATLGTPNTATLTITANDVPTVQFAPSNYTVTEDCTFVTITVTRSGDPSAAATVRYFSNPIQASERSDYTTAIGTLRFGVGVTTASFALLITEDSLAEATEMLTIDLSNPTGGAQLGAASTATVAITDDGDTGSGQNPIDDPGTFVCQHYHDFLARQADDAGQLFWTNQITACGTDQECLAEKRTNVSAAFFLSVEFQQTGYFVMRTYKTAFGNQPDTPIYDTFIADTGEVNRGVIVGQGAWEAQLLANQQAYLLAFVSRGDFMASYPPGQTAAQYVDALFLSAGVTPSGAERQAAIDAYGTGDASGRAGALRSVVESDSIYNAFYNPAFVLMEYYGYLRRNPNAAPDNNFQGYNFWLAKMDSFSLPGENVRDAQVALSRVRRAQMVTAFITSAEYRQRFGQP
ncbi:MAG: CSLREA domain-containing protein [Pyrinomonadaceae bacterium]|nr:CSLREA domain-containing protein [Pyrinomonadaceae bacterium]